MLFFAHHLKGFFLGISGGGTKNMEKRIKKKVTKQAWWITSSFKNNRNFILTVRTKGNELPHINFIHLNNFEQVVNQIATAIRSYFNNLSANRQRRKHRPLPFPNKMVLFSHRNFIITSLMGDYNTTKALIPHKTKNLIKGSLVH